MLPLFLALVAYAGPNDHQWNRKRPDEPLWDKVAVPTAKLSQRLQGRILGILIQKGMTRPPIDFLLGRNRSSEIQWFPFGGAKIDSFQQLGLIIHYSGGRVQKVGFLPFFD